MKRKTPVSPTKANIGERIGDGKESKVRCRRKMESLIAENTKASPKLVIFNIHGTLLDCGSKWRKIRILP
jgi:hypothetical protein